MNAVLERTTKEDQELAKSSFSVIREKRSQITRSDMAFAKINIPELQSSLKIPKKAFKLLVVILENMAQGKSITLIPSDTILSTQQAADMLNVSRPHLVKLLEYGEIPFKKVGTHRRIELKDIIAYEKKTKEIQNDKLDFLTRQGQDLNLGY